MEDEHRQIMEKLRIKFKMAEEHVKGVREEERNRLRSLSAKYREYKVRATHMLNERVEQLFQEGLGSIERRERQFVRFSLKPVVIPGNASEGAKENCPAK